METESPTIVCAGMQDAEGVIDSPEPWRLLEARCAEYHGGVDPAHRNRTEVQCMERHYSGGTDLPGTWGNGRAVESTTMAMSPLPDEGYVPSLPSTASRTAHGKTYGRSNGSGGTVEFGRVPTISQCRSRRKIRRVIFRCAEASSSGGNVSDQ